MLVHNFVMVNIAGKPQIHGLSDEFLEDKPKFADVVDGFLAFIGDSNLVIHNADFDMKFLNAELDRLKLPPLPMSRVVDTLEVARKKFPGSPASLNALCKRFGIDNSARTLHGALLDAQILAKVYFELIGGRQPDLVPSGDSREPAGADAGVLWRPPPRPEPLPPRITDEEARAHSEFIKKLDPDALWSRDGRHPTILPALPDLPPRDHASPDSENARSRTGQDPA